MPELPEVETVVREIRPHLKSQKILDFCIYNNYSRIILGRSLASLKKNILGKEIIAVERRAKYIVFQLAPTGYLVLHLRMTGQIQFVAEPPKHTTFSIKFKKQQMHFVDTRKFGTVEYLATLDPLNEKLGPEPLGSEFVFANFKDQLNKSGKNIKSFLLDQSKVAGLGNIYVDEILWSAKVHPTQLAKNLSNPKIKAIYQAIPQILNQSIKHQGTTFINFYFAEAKTGNFQKLLKVFNKTGESCPRCAAKIVKIKYAGRGTHLCPKCQKC